MAVSYLNSNTILTAGGTYIVDSSGAARTITLPLLSAVGSDGMLIRVIRDGGNAVTVQRQDSDQFWDSTNNRSLDDDNSAVAVVARNSGSVWYEIGRYRTVT